MVYRSKFGGGGGGGLFLICASFICCIKHFKVFFFSVSPWCRSLLLGAKTSEKYTQFFRLLLYIEEHQMENDIHVYDRYDQTMKTLNGGSKLLSLEVSWTVLLLFQHVGQAWLRDVTNILFHLCSRQLLKTLPPDLPAVKNALRFYISTK